MTQVNISLEVPFSSHPMSEWAPVF